MVLIKKAVKEELIIKLRNKQKETEENLKNELSFNKAIKDWKDLRFYSGNFAVEHLSEFYSDNEIKKSTYIAYKKQVIRWIDNFSRGYIFQLKAKKFNFKNMQKEVIQ